MLCPTDARFSLLSSISPNLRVVSSRWGPAARRGNLWPTRIRSKLNGRTRTARAFGWNRPAATESFPPRLWCPRCWSPPSDWCKRPVCRTFLFVRCQLNSGRLSEAPAGVRPICHRGLVTWTIDISGPYRGNPTWQQRYVVRRNPATS